MTKSCCIPGCKSNYNSTLKAGGQPISTFSFPKNDDLKDKWLKAILRDNWAPTKYSVVCALHFPETDIIREDKFLLPDGTMKMIPTKTRLSLDAVPSIFPNLSQYLPKKVRQPRKSPEEIRRDNLARSLEQSDSIANFPSIRLEPDCEPGHRKRKMKRTSLLAKNIKAESILKDEILNNQEMEDESIDMKSNSNRNRITAMMNRKSRRGFYCAVRGCTARPSKVLSFFYLPRDRNRRLEWIKACNRPEIEEKDEYFLKHTRVCARHFKENMFLNDLKNRLQPHAVPCLFLDGNEDPNDSQVFEQTKLDVDIDYEIESHNSEEFSNKEMRDMICVFAQENFCVYSAANKYMDLYPDRVQPHQEFFQILHNRLGETGSFRKPHNLNSTSPKIEPQEDTTIEKVEVKVEPTEYDDNMLYYDDSF